MLFFFFFKRYLPFHLFSCLQEKDGEESQRIYTLKMNHKKRGKHFKTPYIGICSVPSLAASSSNATGLAETGVSGSTPRSLSSRSTNSGGFGAS